jgi:hypothetical protein
MKNPKKFYEEIPVAPEMEERFKNGCTYYGMTFTKKRGSSYFTVGFDKAIDLYWLAANLYGEIPTNGITKRSF